MIEKQQFREVSHVQQFRVLYKVRLCGFLVAITRTSTRSTAVTAFWSKCLGSCFVARVHDLDKLNEPVLAVLL